MAGPDIVMYEQEFNQIKTILVKLRTDSNAQVVFLVDKNGRVVDRFAPTDTPESLDAKIAALLA